MREKDFQAKFAEKNKINGIFELKFCNLTQKKSIPFNALEDHQEEALVNSALGDGMYHKISDIPKPKLACLKCKHNTLRFQKKRPFDCFLLRSQDAYVVVMFWIPRKKKNVYYITIQDFIKMRDEADRKSFTEDMAREYSMHQFNYLKR